MDGWVNGLRPCFFLHASRPSLSRKLPEFHEYDTWDGGVCGSASQVRHILAHSAGFLLYRETRLAWTGSPSARLPASQNRRQPPKIPSYPRGGLGCPGFDSPPLVRYGIAQLPYGFETEIQQDDGRLDRIVMCRATEQAKRAKILIFDVSFREGSMHF